MRSSPADERAVWPIEPMLAVAGTLPADPGRWALEVKWDGVPLVSFDSSFGHLPTPCARMCPRR
jgi:hypothetical protein